MVVVAGLKTGVHFFDPVPRGLVARVMLYELVKPAWEK